MGEPSELNIPKALEEIGEAVLASLGYRRYPLDRLDKLMVTVEEIVSHPSNRARCEEHLKSLGSNYVLFFLSNILYNLKQRGQLVLTEDVLKWLGSVWKNFMKRNRTYQEMFPRFDEYRIKLRKYYPGAGTFVNQIENVNMIKDEFNLDKETPDSPIRKLEHFHNSTQEIIAAMKPSYFFLLDYHYEKKMSNGIDTNEAVAHEAGGLAKFGHLGHTYLDITLLSCQSLGILEAAYLILKKKKSQRRLIVVDGKQKFLTTPEIYNMFLEKFNAMKKELAGLTK